MQASATDNESKWKFAQCFGDKGESDDITEGKLAFTAHDRKLLLTICMKKLISFRLWSLITLAITWQRVTKVAEWCCLNAMKV